MEKISRIVPTSPRLEAVDMATQRPVRSSAPSFGGPVSESANRGPKKSAVVESARVYNETYGADAKMAREAEMVKKLSDQFFVNQGRMPIETAPEIKDEATSPSLENMEPVMVALPEQWIEIPSHTNEDEPIVPKSVALSVRA